MAKKPKNRMRWANKYFKRNTGKTREDFHAIIKKDYDHAIERAKELLSIPKLEHQKAQPIIITVPDAYGKDSVSYRLDTNQDGSQTLLYDHSLVTILMFGEAQLYYYQSHINHQTGDIGYDLCGEIKYFDIVHIETELGYDDIDKPRYNLLDVTLNLVNGQSITLHLRNHLLSAKYPTDDILLEKEKLVIDTLKNAVRSVA